MQEKKEFQLLIVSDIHDNIENTRKLVNWVNNSKKKFDYVICPGDIVTVPSNKQDDPQMEATYLPEMASILGELEKIAPVIYVPGNHEPGKTFKVKPQLTPKSTNLHKSYMQLEENLFIVGIGGSTPILAGEAYKIGQIPFADLDVKKTKYDGYPYNVDSSKESNFTDSDEMLRKDLDVGLEEMKKVIKDNDSVILLSHNGPLYTLSNFQTVIDQGPEGPVENNIYLGSAQIGQVFLDDDKMILDIHGHAHPSRASINFTSTKTIFNPGDLASKNFGIIGLKKSDDKKWKVYTTSLNLV